LLQIFNTNKKASSTVRLKRLESSFALRAYQATADASSAVTQYRHAYAYPATALGGWLNEKAKFMKAEQ